MPFYFRFRDGSSLFNCSTIIFVISRSVFALIIFGKVTAVSPNKEVLINFLLLFIIIYFTAIQDIKALEFSGFKFALIIIIKNITKT